MNDVRVLVAEDEERWQNQIGGPLKNLGIDVQPALAYDEAVESVRENSYDLAIVDLGLQRDTGEFVGLSGIALIAEIRRSEFNKHCAIIVITGHATKEARKEIGKYDVFQVIDKNAYPEKKELVEIILSAIRIAQVKRAAAADSERLHLTIAFSHTHVIKSELMGQGRHAISDNSRQQGLDVFDLARRADLLNWMIEEGGPEVWREEARSIGKAIYNSLAADRDVLGHLKAARAMARSPGDVWLKFSGPSIGLGIPFELIRDETSLPLALNHILSRRITSPLADGMTRKLEPFHEFVGEFQKSRRTLRVLIVGANSDGRIPAAEQEASQLKELIEAKLDALGIKHKVELLNGSEASYERVCQALGAEKYHIFHYCGHGHYDDSLAERSGLILRDGWREKTLTANELYSLCSKNQNLRLVFLSTCTSARTAERLGRGDFYSVFESLASSDVPVVIGYRWSVADSQAKQLALVFYSELWRTFSPGESMLLARQNAYRAWGGDDDTWASPVMLMQNV